MPETFFLPRTTSQSGADPITWVAMDSGDDETARWLENESGLPKQVIVRLLEDTKLNRRESVGGGVVLCYYSRKIIPGTSDSDSTSIRLWIENDRVISVSSDAVPALETMKSMAAQQQGTWAPFEVLNFLVNNHLGELETLIVSVSSETDELEDQILDLDDESNIEDLDKVRRMTIRTRRDLVALRNLLVFIVSDQSLTISGQERRALEAATDRVRSYLEIMEDCHERAHLLRDQMESQMDARLNRITYNLTIVATVFLPLSFLTGLLGMNVAGIPDEHNPLGFVAVCSIMVLIAIVSWIFLRWRKWI